MNIVIYLPLKRVLFIATAIHLAKPAQAELNKSDAANPAIAFPFQTGHHWRGVADPGR
jgi:hypothetical protein